MSTKFERYCPWEFGNYKPSSIKYYDENKGAEYWDGYYFVNNTFCEVYAQKEFKKKEFYISISIYKDGIRHTYIANNVKTITERGLKIYCTKCLKRLAK